MTNNFYILTIVPRRRMKQLSKERARGLRVMQRLDSLHAEEREKVKAGKKPFFLKQSVINTINLEERYVYKKEFCSFMFLFGLCYQNKEQTV